MTVPAGGATPGAAGARGIGLLLGVDLLARTSYGICRTPLLPLYAASLGAGPAMVGVVGAASTLTGVLLKLPSGVLSDAIGRFPVLLLGLVAFATGPFLALAAAGPLTLLAVRLYHGTATALYSPASMAVVSAAAGPRKGELLAWLSNAKIAAGLLGAFLGGWLLQGNASGGSTFPTALLVAGGLGVAAAILAIPVLRAARGARAAEPRRWRDVSARFRRGLGEVVTDRSVLLASGSEGVQNLTTGALEQFLPLYAVLVAGRSPFEAGVLWGVQAVVTFASKPLLGRWGDRHDRDLAIRRGLWVCAVPFAALPWATGMLPLALLAAAWGLGEALVTSSASARVADLCRERSLGAAMGVFGTIGDVGHAAGPLLVGAALGLAAAAGAPAAVGYRLSFGLVAAVLAAYALLLARRRRGA